VQITPYRGTGSKGIPTTASHLDFAVGGVYIRFHVAPRLIAWREKLTMAPPKEPAMIRKSAKTGKRRLQKGVFFKN
jgi:hypothetical protein